MTPRGGIDHLRQMHQMCMEELLGLQQSISAYSQSSAEMHKQLTVYLQQVNDDADAICSGAAGPLIAYDNFLTNLSHVMELARKFNLHLRFNKLEERLFHGGGGGTYADVNHNNINNNNNNNCQLRNDFKTNLNLSWHLKVQTQDDAFRLERGQVNGRRSLAPPPGFECIEGAESNERVEEITKTEEVDAPSLSPAVLQEQPKLEDSPCETPDAAASTKQEINGGYDFDTLSIPPIDEHVEQINDSALFEAKISGSAFRYPAMELSAYQPGCVINASITFVQDSRRLRFFICDTRSPGMASVLELHHMVNLRQYASLPPANEIFGLVLDDVILRAVRANKSEANTTSAASEDAYPALLLDFGEVVDVSTAADIMYHLPAAQKQTPAQAIMCQLHNGYDSNNPNYRDEDALQTQLEQLEYQRASFRIQAVVEEVLHVQLITKDDDDTDVNKKEIIHQPVKSTWPNTNPFLPSAASNQEFILNEEFASFDPTEEIVPLQPISRDPIDPSAAAAAAAASPNNSLTRQDWEMLYEEPLATTNAMTAVMGYDPKDDLRICRFYDPAIGGCFKGVNCKQEHIATQPDGWTKDVLPAATIVDTRTPVTCYAAGSIISITPTYVGQLERFYAQIDDPKSPQTPLIWNPEDVPDWKRLSKPPLTFELVLARYDDEMWYRAKIIESDEQGKMFSVFYVDYGNHQVVPMRDLARCDYAIAQLPFQAVLFRLANVRDEPEASPELRKRGINTLCKLILNQTFDVKVLGHHEDLLVRFVEERFVNLPSTLINMGCARPFRAVAT